MRLIVHKDVCPYCNATHRPAWTVTDTRGHLHYLSDSWRQALDYAYAATHPGTGVQVQPIKKVSNA